MHLLMQIIYSSNDPLIVDTWATFMWILCQCALSVYINTKIKFLPPRSRCSSTFILVLILSFPEISSVSEREIFRISLRKTQSFSFRRLYKLKTFVRSVAVSNRKAQKNQQVPMHIFKLIGFTPFRVPFLKIQRFRKQQCYKTRLLRVLIKWFEVFKENMYVNVLEFACKQGIKSQVSYWYVANGE